MSPRNEVFQAVPFDGATSDAKEPLIATGDAEEKDQHGLEERDLFSFQLSSLLLGLLVGFLIQFASLVGAHYVVIHFGMKSNTDIVGFILLWRTDVIVFSLLWSLFTVVAPLVLIWEFIRNLGRSKELLEDTVLRLECRFCVGAVAGICLAWTIMDVLMSTRVHVVGYPFAIIVFAFILYDGTMASATDSKPSATRRSTAEQTMMTV
jgi:hypothetical protein